MSGSPAFVIKTQELTKSFKGVKALDALNLMVPRNSIFGFLGPNGSGKSTAIKLLLGLSRPTAGRATVFGLDSVKDSTQIRQRIGYLAQDPRFYEHLTARETLRFTARFFYKGPKKAIEERIEETLDLVGLTNKADRPIKGFSGGERQRLGIAQAQINYPDLLILDEPAASLDPMGRHDVLEVMARLRQHTTIFYSTHILGDVQRVSDTVAILKQGKLIAQAPVEQLLVGNGETVYRMVVKGRVNGARSRVASQPWVSSSIVTPTDHGLMTWEIGVTDAVAAENHLLRLLLEDHELEVVSFGRKKYELEEVFMTIVEGDQHVH